MRKTVISLMLIVCVLMSGVLYTNVNADEEVIKIGYQSNGNFIDNIDSINSKGYGYEVFKKIEEISDLRFEYVQIESDPFATLDSGVVDVIGFYVKTEERSEDYIYSETNFSKAYIVLTTENQDILYDDPMSIDGKTVATYHGNIGNEHLDEYCEEHSISVNYIYGDITDYEKLDADFYVTYMFNEENSDRQTVLNLSIRNIHLVSTYENQEIMDKINEVFMEVVVTEGNFFMELEEKYLSYNINLNHRDLRKDELEILRQRPLQVAYLEGYPPHTFTNDSGEPDGSYVDIMNFLAHEYNFEVEYKPININSILDEHADIDIYLGLYGVREDLLEKYEYTEAFESLPMYVTVPRDVFLASSTAVDLRETVTTVGTLRYHRLNFDYYSDIFENTEFVYYDDFDRMLYDFSVGDLSATLFTDSATTYLELYLKNDDYRNYPADFELPLSFLISKDISDDYIPIFNVMFDTISDSEYQSILLTNSNDFLPEYTSTDYVRDNWYIFAIIIFVVALGFVIYLYIHEKERQNIKIKAYDIDSLTGIYTSAKFMDIVREKIKSAKPQEYELVTFDIDFFKSINAYYSTQKGNEVLKAIAQALNEAYYGTDTIFARTTVDHFVIFKKHGTIPRIERVYAEKIIPAIRSVIGNRFNVSMSFGKYVIHNTKDKITNMIGYADEARNKGKDLHEFTYYLFDDKMMDAYNKKIDITVRMDQALKDNEFVVHYQPKIDFETLRITGAEALVRWIPKVGGTTVYPNDFIPVFENNGFISSIDKFVFEEVCKLIAENRETIINVPVISTNLSGITVLDKNLVFDLVAIMKKHGVSSDEIELEVTESAIINEKKFLKRVKELKEEGFKIALDDFGTGVSSLNRLSAIEADVLKLDKSFFDLKINGGKGLKVVESVISMAKTLDMQIVAEGVETVEQAGWLKDLTCDIAQGYLFAKPMSEHEFKKLLKQKKTYELV